MTNDHVAYLYENSNKTLIGLNHNFYCQWNNEKNKKTLTNNMDLNGRLMPIINNIFCWVFFFNRLFGLHFAPPADSLTKHTVKYLLRPPPPHKHQTVISKWISRVNFDDDLLAVWQRAHLIWFFCLFSVGFVETIDLLFDNSILGEPEEKCASTAILGEVREWFSHGR